MRRACNPLSWQLLAVAVPLLAGCNDALQRGEVSGRVTLDGQPVSGGVVVFVPERGPQAIGNLDESGRYRLQTPGAGSGAVQGNHTVFFQPRYDTAPLAHYTPEDEMEGVPPPELKPLLHPPLPDKWLSLTSSDLRAQVRAGNNQLNWSLELGTPGTPNAR